MSEDPEESLQDRRKNEYADLKRSIDTRADENDKRLSGFIRKTLVAFAILGIASTVSLIGFSIVLGKIQQERYDNVYQSCIQQNEQHDKTLKKTDALLSPKHSKPGQEIQLAKTKIFVRLVVDELRPKVDDCKAYTKTRVKSGF